jgi:glutamine amidotransferase
VIAVLDYGIGNLRSAEKALQHLGVDAALTTDPDVARRAKGVVLPGVGAFGRCMEQLRESGLEPVVHEAVEAGKPFLGICVGMQMLFDTSEEAPGSKGLGIIPGEVRKLTVTSQRLPHMGWNTLTITHGSVLFDGIDNGSWLYFVHSYAPVPDDPAVVAATTDYGGEVVAAVERDHVWATQFHPEKSAAKGLLLLSNFARRCAGEPDGASPETQ